MGTIECSQPASKSSWDCQDFGDISMVLKMAHFRRSIGPRWVNQNSNFFIQENAIENVVCLNGCHFVQGGGGVSISIDPDLTRLGTTRLVYRPE